MIAIPPRIARLPKDKRGYPIPWNVQVGNDNTPLFTVNSMEKHVEAIQKRLCPICGERLGRWIWFTGGIRSAYDPHGAYYDLPGHRECEEFALQVCPYLSMPKYLGRIDVVDPSKVPDEMTLHDITVIPERPEVFVAVATDDYEISAFGEVNTPVLTPKRPYLAVKYWRHGKLISTEEAVPYLNQILGANWVAPALRGV